MKRDHLLALRAEALTEAEHTAEKLRKTRRLIAQLDAMIENESPSDADHATDIRTPMLSTSQAKPKTKMDPEVRRRRTEAIVKSRRSDERPFFRWLGTRSLADWVSAQKPDPHTGKPLTYGRIMSYFRRGLSGVQRVKAPTWLRERVFEESGGQVPMSSWDD